MTARDRLRALAVVLVLGLQFPATSIALEVFPPFTLGALRFALVAVPTVMFVRPPVVRLRWLVGYGLGLGVGEFALLYLALRAGMPAGLASLVLQSSAPFTLLLAVIWLRERPTGRQYAGLAIALAGLGIVVVHHLHGAVLGPLLLTVAAGLSWAVGNICARRAQPARPVDFTLWMSVIPPAPMILLSLRFYGPGAIVHSLGAATSAAGLPAVGAVLFIAFVCTVLGTGGWSALLVRYPPQTVAPLSMLVPVAGTASSALVLGERLDATTLLAGAVILLGLLVITSRASATSSRLTRHPSIAAAAAAAISRRRPAPRRTPLH